jgi:hypothetical protein
MQIEMFSETIELEKALQEGEECYHCNGCKKTKAAHKFNDYALKILRAKFDPNRQSQFDDGTNRGSGSAILCRQCKSKRSKSHREALKTAPPKPTKPTPCANCFEVTEPKDLRMDHCHETHKFRGYLCHTCNTGIGSLGDNIEGLERAIRYLEKFNDQ